MRQDEAEKDGSEEDIFVQETIEDRATNVWVNINDLRVSTATSGSTPAAPL